MKHRKIVWPALIAACVAYAFMAAAAIVSFTHIVHTANTLGLGDWQHWITPFFIDGFALLGKVGRIRRFKRNTRIAGLVILALAGTLSLACNVYAGDNLGEQLFGVLTVACFIGAEWYATRLLDEISAQEGTETTTVAGARRPKSDEERLEAARRRAGYYQMDSTARTAWTRKYNDRVNRRQRREIGSIDTSFVAPDVAVHPAGLNGHAMTTSV